MQASNPTYGRQVVKAASGGLSGSCPLSPATTLPTLRLQATAFVVALHGRSTHGTPILAGMGLGGWHGSTPTLAESVWKQTWTLWQALEQEGGIMKHLSTKSSLAYESIVA